MSMNIRCNRVGELGVQIILVFHVNGKLFFLGWELGECFFRANFSLILLELLILRETESGITCMYRAGNENEFVAKIFNTNFTEARDSIERAALVSLHVRSVDILTRIFLTRFEQLNNIWYDYQLSREYGLVSRLGMVHDITSENWFYHWKKQSIHIRVRRKLRTLWDCAPSNSHYSRNHKVFVKKTFSHFLSKKISRLQMTVTHRTMLKNYIASKNLDSYFQN